MQKPGEPGQTARPAYPIASVDNALRLLTLFREQTRVRLSEASEHLGVAHSSAHRLLAMLAYHGFVRQERDSRACVAGPALVEIGLATIRHMDIRLHARPVLEELARSWSETVHLAVLEGSPRTARPQARRCLPHCPNPSWRPCSARPACCQDSPPGRSPAWPV